MNELDMVVTLCLHQLEHVVNGALPGDLSQCLVFEAPALVDLRHRIEELEQERIVQKRQHQYANFLFLSVVGSFAYWNLLPSLLHYYGYYVHLTAFFPGQPR